MVIFKPFFYLFYKLIKKIIKNIYQIPKKCLKI